MRFTALCCSIFLLILISCRVEEEKGMKPLDLAKYGLEMSILAPDSTQVSIKEYPSMRDITIRKDDHFYIELFELESGRSDPEVEKQRQLAAIKKDPSFLEVVKEFDKGFIYSKLADSTTIDYDFRYMRNLGSNQLIFQSGVLTTFALEDIERMVEAIKDHQPH